MPVPDQSQTSPEQSRLERGDVLVIVAGLILLSGMILSAGSPAHDSLPDFSSMPTEQKKREFFEFLSPKISAVNFEQAEDRDRVRRLREEYAQNGKLGWFERRWIDRLASRLEVPIDEMELGEALEVLERRAGIVPESIVLVQAALESGWGTSRFAQEGNNLFGQRCYRPDCGMVPRERAEGSRFGLARFASIQAAVESYMLNLNTHPEYRRFREIRQRLREGGAPITGLALIDGLVGYSERGSEYVQQVASMIRANELE